MPPTPQVGLHTPKVGTSDRPSRAPDPFLRCPCPHSHVHDLAHVDDDPPPKLPTVLPTRTDAVHGLAVRPHSHVHGLAHVDDDVLRVPPQQRLLFGRHAVGGRGRAALELRALEIMVSRIDEADVMATAQAAAEELFERRRAVLADT